MAAGALVTSLITLIHCLEAISSPDGQVSTALQEMEGRKGEGGRTLTRLPSCKHSKNSQVLCLCLVYKLKFYFSLLCFGSRSG